MMKVTHELIKILVFLTIIPSLIEYEIFLLNFTISLRGRKVFASNLTMFFRFLCLPFSAMQIPVNGKCFSFFFRDDRNSHSLPPRDSMMFVYNHISIPNLTSVFIEIIPIRWKRREKKGEKIARKHRFEFYFIACEIDICYR